MNYYPLILVWLVVAAPLLPGCYDDRPAAPTEDSAGDAGRAGDGLDGGVGDGVDGERPAQTPVGMHCDGPNQCVGAASCIGTTAADDFICMRNCATPGRICADGSVCAPRVSPDEPVCYTGGATAAGQPCQNNLDCRAGTLCFGVDAERYCLAACHEADPRVCPEATHCQVGSDGGGGLCRPNVGAGCDRADDCAGQLACSSELGSALADALPDGYCTRPQCRADADCPDHSVCRTVPSTDRTICMATCIGDPDCRFNQDYRCLDQRSCSQADDSAGCQAFRDGHNICLPVGLREAF